MTIKEKTELTKLIIEFALLKYPNIFATCSFGKDSRVLVDLVMQVNPEVSFYGIDTTYEFSETLKFSEGLLVETGMNFSWLRPTEVDIEKVNTVFGSEFIKNGQYKCCAMKKPAITPVINKHDAWITGLRRDESETRKDIPVIEKSESIVKIHPLAFWTVDDIWEYINTNNLSYHPLYKEGYPSLGCEPCTKKGVDGTLGERSGRFSDSNSQRKECGLHFS